MAKKKAASAPKVPATMPMKKGKVMAEKASRTMVKGTRGGSGKAC